MTLRRHWALTGLQEWPELSTFSRDQELLVIDAGTAITYDFLSGGIYKGGNISPGLNMRFRALNRFTGKLPLDYTG